MSKFNPDFWEVTISAESWRRFSTEDRLHYREPGETDRQRAHAERARAFCPQIRAIIEEVLTDRQREVLLLYFFEGLNQRQIAERLGITQQSVGERLHGKARNGRAVGGALRKLRRVCAKRGFHFE